MTTYVDGGLTYVTLDSRHDNSAGGAHLWHRGFIEISGEQLSSLMSSTDIKHTETAFK